MEYNLIREIGVVHKRRLLRNYTLKKWYFFPEINFAPAIAFSLFHIVQIQFKPSPLFGETYN